MSTLAYGFWPINTTLRFIIKYLLISFLSSMAKISMTYCLGNKLSSWLYFMYICCCSKGRKTDPVSLFMKDTINNIWAIYLGFLIHFMLPSKPRTFINSFFYSIFLFPTDFWVFPVYSDYGKCQSLLIGIIHSLEKYSSVQLL